MIKLQRFDFNCFWKLAETLGNSLAYVDIEGVTGSIPVAPTIFCKGLGRLSCHAEEQDRAERRNSFRSIGRLPRHAPLQLGSGNGVEIECIARQLSAANNRNLPRHESARA
jgi:hypothetical protein